MSNNDTRNETITNDPETNAERREREAFEASTPAQQQQYMAELLKQFNKVASYVERKLED